MNLVSSSIVVLGLGLGTWQAGKDLFDSAVTLAQVTAERANMSEIGKSLQTEFVLKSRKVTPEKLPAFITQHVVVQGRDPTKDIWGTPYQLSDTDFRGLRLRKGTDEYVLHSAGPDKTFETSDDLLWASLNLPTELATYSTPALKPEVTQEDVMAKMEKFENEKKEALDKLQSLASTSHDTATTQ